MIKVAGFLGGCIGDLINQTVVCRAFKEQNSNSHITFCFSQKFRQIEPLLYDNFLFDSIHMWEGYDDSWPTKNDVEFIKQNRFNIIYNPMATHKDDFWYLKFKYAEEFCLMFGLNPPKNLQPYINSKFNQYNNCSNIITLSMCPSFDVGMKKSLSIEQLNKLCKSLKQMNFIPIQLGGKFDKKIEEAENPNLSLFEATKLLYSSRLHLTTDTSFAWISSALDGGRPTIGFYTNNLPYMTEQTSKNIQPINPNQFIFHRENLWELKVEEIIEKIKEMI